MKKFLILAVATIMVVTAQAREGSESNVGNGGDVLVCPTGVQMYDAYEATKRGYTLDLGGSDLTLDEKIELVMKRIEEAIGDPPSSEDEHMNFYLDQLMSDFKEYTKKPGQPYKGKFINFTTEDLIDIPDTGRGGHPANCEIKQLMTQKEVEYFGDVKYSVDIKLLDKLDLDNITMLFFHEVFWNFMHHRYPDGERLRGSEMLRLAVGIVSSRELDNGSVLDKGTLAYIFQTSWNHYLPNTKIEFEQPDYINKTNTILEPRIDSASEHYRNGILGIWLTLQGVQYRLEVKYLKKPEYRPFDAFYPITFFENGKPSSYRLLGQYHLQVGNQSYSGLPCVLAQYCESRFAVHYDSHGQIMSITDEMSQLTQDEYIKKKSDEYFGNESQDTFKLVSKKLFYVDGTLAVSANENIFESKKSLTVLDRAGNPIPPLQEITAVTPTAGIVYLNNPTYKGFPIIMRSQDYLPNLNFLCAQLGDPDKKIFDSASYRGEGMRTYYRGSNETVTFPKGAAYAYVTGSGELATTFAGEDTVLTQIETLICLGSDFTSQVPTSDF